MKKKKNAGRYQKHPGWANATREIKLAKNFYDAPRSRRWDVFSGLPSQKCVRSRGSKLHLSRSRCRSAFIAILALVRRHFAVKCLTSFRASASTNHAETTGYTLPRVASHVTLDNERSAQCPATTSNWTPLTVQLSTAVPLHPVPSSNNDDDTGTTLTTSRQIFTTLCTNTG